MTPPAPTTRRHETAPLLHVFRPRTCLDGLPDPNRPAMFADVHHTGAMTMLGAAHIEPISGFWERHDEGDEVLIVLAGRMTFTAERGVRRQSEDVIAGDVLHIAAGAAHTATVHEAVDLVFLTPADGNQAWTEQPDGPRRHA